MSIVTTIGKYCFVECDRPRCNKKIEHVDPKTLKQLARLCGWENIDDQWICVDCAAKSQVRTSPAARRRRSLPGGLKTSPIR